MDFANTFCFNIYTRLHIAYTQICVLNTVFDGDWESLKILLLQRCLNSEQVRTTQQALCVFLKRILVLRLLKKISQSIPSGPLRY